MLSHLFLLLSAGLVLFWSANLLVKSITQVSRYLQWREFVLAFFVMAIAGSFPNLFVGISSAFHDVPELSFGDVVGNSVVDLTLVVALAAFIGKELVAESAMVQASSVFTIAVAILPMLLILDGTLGRGDGAALLVVFFFYSAWLFSKRRDFTQAFDRHSEPLPSPVLRFRRFLLNLAAIALGVTLLVVSAEGLVRGVMFFAERFSLPITLIGVLGLGLANALPEIYFAVASARKGRNLIILGELMGSVMVLATLVLGTVALLNPIEIEDFSPFAIARFFLIISALFFLIFARTDRKVSGKEGLFLLGLYLTFVAAEIFTNAQK